jgi:hypothetical protein
VMQPEDTHTAVDIFRSVKELGDWSESTIWQNLMSNVTNLPPARRHWPSKNPFLFIRPDGAYEIYDPARHPPIRD